MHVLLILYFALSHGAQSPIFISNSFTPPSPCNTHKNNANSTVYNSNMRTVLSAGFILNEFQHPSMLYTTKKATILPSINSQRKNY